MKRILIGVGNRLRGDDGVGLVVAERVRSIESIQSPGASFELMDLWQDADEVILVDAARSGARPGTIHRLDAALEPLPGTLLATSTHSIGLSDTVELARRLGRLPGRVVVFGVEAGNLAQREGLSPDVARAVDELVEMIDGA